MTTSTPLPTPDSIAAALIADATNDASRDAASFHAMIDHFDADLARIADIIIDDARDSDTYFIFATDDDDSNDAYTDALHDDRTHALLTAALDRLRTDIPRP